MWWVITTVGVALAVWLTYELARIVRRQSRTTVDVDFRKAKELERRKNTDLSAFP
jgi:hypothetical protein